IIFKSCLLTRQNLKERLRMDKEKLRELTHELDHELGSINIKREVLNAISTEMGVMQDDVQNTDQMNKPIAWNKLNEIRSTLLVLTELLQYTVKDLNMDYENAQSIKESFHD